MMPPVSYCIDHPCNASSAAGKRWKGSRNTRILGYENLLPIALFAETTPFGKHALFV